jgi:hypothetical protein
VAEGGRGAGVDGLPLHLIIALLNESAVALLVAGSAIDTTHLRDVAFCCGVAGFNRVVASTVSVTDLQFSTLANGSVRRASGVLAFARGDPRLTQGTRRAIAHGDPPVLTGWAAQQRSAVLLRAFELAHRADGIFTLQRAGLICRNQVARRLTQCVRAAGVDDVPLLGVATALQIVLVALNLARDAGSAGKRRGIAVARHVALGRVEAGAVAVADVQGRLVFAATICLARETDRALAANAVAILLVLTAQLL